MANDLVYIEWWDAEYAAEPGWKDLDSMSPTTLSLIRSAGWIVSETDQALRMAGHTSEGQCFGELTIPKSAIERRIVIEVPGSTAKDSISTDDL